MKKYILTLLITALLPLNLTFASSDEQELTLVDIAKLVNLIPDLEMYDLNLFNISGITVTTSEDEVLDFDLSIDTIGRIFGKTKVKFQTDFLENENLFSFWKIRIRCEENAEAYLEGNSENMCNSSTEKHNLDKDGGYITFVNNSDKATNIEVKFRAFGEDNNWLASETNNILLQPSK